MKLAKINAIRYDNEHLISVVLLVLFEAAAEGITVAADGLRFSFCADGSLRF